MAKYTNYLFGGNDERGLNKGRLITRILGYNINNYLEFDKKVKQAVAEFPATYKKGNEFGDAYEIETALLQSRFGVSGLPRKQREA